MELIDRQIDVIDVEALKSLLFDNAEMVISLYMPTFRAGAEVQQNSIRLKNLLAAVENQLGERGMSPRAIETRLAPLNALMGNWDFWQNQGDGLALFLHDDRLSTFRLPYAVDERVVVSARAYIKPLVPMANHDDDFFVLLLNQGQVQLLQGTRYSTSEVELADDVPRSLEEALQYDEFESHLQYHTGSGRTTDSGEQGAMFHGHGLGGDEAIDKENILRFFRALDNGVRAAIGESQAPLVLVGIEYLQGAYRQVNHYGRLLDAGVDSNPDDLSVDVLHARVWEIVSPLFAQDRQQAYDQYKHLQGNQDERAAASVEEIVPAAYFQRIDTLFLQEGQERWGTFDAEANQVRVVESPSAFDDEELMDFTVVHTLLNGGTVYVVPASEMPDDAPLAAIFRY